MKRCNTCLKDKEYKSYYVKSSTKDGYDYKCIDCHKLYKINRKESESKISKKYYIKNKEERILKSRLYELNNKEKVRENHRLYMQKRRKEPSWRLKESILSLLNIKLKNKTQSHIAYLGCSIEEYKLYLESKFTPEMSWENYGRKGGYWEIDHIIPISSFDLNNEEEVLKAFNYLNTQPLTITENRTKSNKI